MSHSVEKGSATWIPLQGQVAEIWILPGLTSLWVLMWANLCFVLLLLLQTHLPIMCVPQLGYYCVTRGLAEHPGVFQVERELITLLSAGQASLGGRRVHQCSPGPTKFLWVQGEATVYSFLLKMCTLWPCVTHIHTSAFGNRHCTLCFYDFYFSLLYFYIFFK